MNDNQIVEKIKIGDESALEFLYKKHYRMIVRLVMKNSGTEDEAKDIFQEALFTFWRKVIQDNLILTSKISTYLYSICLNLWRKELDRKKRFSSEEKDTSFIENIDEEERVNAIQKCISELGETCQKVLTMYYFDGFSMKEVADKLGFANADTAKTKKYKCKQELDKLVKTKYKETDFFD